MDPLNEVPSSAYAEGTCFRSRDRIGDFPQSEPPIAPGQTLLLALQKLIIPLVQETLPDSKDRQYDMPLGHEAEDLLSALQRYITSIIKCRSESKSVNETTLTVDLKDKSSQVAPSRKKAGQGGNANKTSTVHGSPTQDLRNDTHELLAMAMVELQARVFNDMPIRLLRTEKQGTKICISLLDRAAIYSYLVPQLKDRFLLWKEKWQRSSTKNLIPQSQMHLIRSEWISDVAKYAILSHTWLRSTPGEVTYDDWQKGNFDLKHPPYEKVVNFCRVAEDHHSISLGWMDTICIDKSSSSELDESIRSMYKWYQKAKVCITYLAETSTISDMAADTWFTRGWTLQELLAPQRIKFYARNWRPLTQINALNDKFYSEIQLKIQKATTITPSDLSSPSSASMSRKMQWAAERKVTRGEDIAYSLMGIFNVSISIAYGEGSEAAFVRLVKKILNNSKSESLDIFNWAGPYKTNASALIPSNPQAYLLRDEQLKLPTTLREPLLLTHLGLRVSVLLLSSIPATLSTRLFTPIGDYYASVNLLKYSPHFKYPTPTVHNVLDVRTDLFTQLDLVRHRCLSFAILNCDGDEYGNIFVPTQCLAIGLLHTGHVPGAATTLESKSKVLTQKPVVFQLKKKTQNPARNPNQHETIPKIELARHGMQFLQMYL
ncbi:hypothetical protein BDN70DRAFT_997359 [Pholiota conissans]|uniref:Heterokaryon incompatibility domain-containing protein n=1 Tax=Pholiota conissans TaxID=109636 RepID=A0A9P5YR71_9AGAR|nr:hypothetical protein BDN70DRAFT_997359 [Pholiota conissans]